jgi:hypothetical protein
MAKNIIEIKKLAERFWDFSALGGIGPCNALNSLEKREYIKSKTMTR